jgi:RNA polymerase sigma-70 factor, ECF subfamily
MTEQVCRTAIVPVRRQSFEEVVLPHLAAARRLARWLMRNADDAEDALQEAALRAFRYFRTFSGGDGRAWFLSIVRNTCRGWRVRPCDAVMDPFDEEQHSTLWCKSNPEVLMHNNDAAALITRAMSDVPDRVRELLVLREVEGLSYRELADVMDLPIGTVMSRLSRARAAFRGAMTATLQQYGIPRWHIVAYERAARPVGGQPDGMWDSRVVKRRAMARRPRRITGITSYGLGRIR